MSKREPPGQELRRLREGAGLGVPAWAELLGVSRVSAWRWEAGKRLPRESILRLARRIAAELSQRGGSEDYACIQAEVPKTRKGPGKSKVARRISRHRRQAAPGPGVHRPGCE